MAARDPRPQNNVEALANQYDQRGRKDATLNMRISSAELDDIKKAAEAAGFPKYQQWLHIIISDAVARQLGMEIETF